MEWLKALWSSVVGGGPEVPEWARFLSADDYRDFERAVRSDLERRGLTYEERDGVALVTGVPEGHPSQFGLQNLAQACGQAPREAWPGIVRRHFDVVMKGPPDVAAIAADFESAKALLKVRLYPSSMLDGKAHVVARALAPGLMAALVFDLPETITTVHPDHVKAWPLALPQLFDLALENVRAAGAPDSAAVDVPGGIQLTLISGESFFAASHALLLPDMLGPLPAHGALVGVPHRHAVVVYPIASTDAILAVNAMIPALRHMFEQGPGSITPELYWLRPSGWTHLPVTVTDEAIQFFPPDEFVAMLNLLAEPPKPANY